MQKAKTRVAYVGTPEQELKLREVISQRRDEKGALMPVLQEAQEIYGYLPVEVQMIIADEMNFSLEEVYGVTTFYGQFSLNPKGKYKVAVCLGTACYVKGAGDIFDRVSKELGLNADEITTDGEFSFEATRCIGACGLAPVMMINDEVYGRLTPDEIPKIFKKYYK